MGYNDSRPLVSFCLKCYNQSEYIGDALDGAFSQTYRPLEIVISDDSSTDGTSEILRRRIKEYKMRGGDIPVVFHRNEQNLGILGNMRIFGRLARGELFVKADGDDVSLPDRVLKIVDAWVAKNKKPKIINHRGLVIDASGLPTGKCVSHLGATQAYSRDCWDKFPVENDVPPRNLRGDDTVYSIHAYALGCGEVYQLLMDDVLVKYRYGCGASTSAKRFRDIDDTYASECIMYALHDIELNRQYVGEVNVENARKYCLRHAREARLNHLLLRGTSIRERIGAALALRKEFDRKSFRDSCYQFLLSMPPFVIDPLLNFYFRVIR